MGAANGRGAARRQVGPAYAAGPTRRRRPIQGKNDLFSISFLSQIHSNEFLNFFKVVSKVGVKMKVVPFFKIYNFAFMTKVKFLLDFEL